MTNTIQNFNDYIDVIKKARYDVEKHYREADTYSLINCFLTINCIVDWIINDKTSNIPAKIVNEANNIAKAPKNSFVFDETKILNNDIIQQTYFVRKVCNRTKHNNSNKSKFSAIKIKSGAKFPLHFPQKLSHVSLEINGQEIYLAPIAENLVNFWENLLKQNGINI